MTPSSSQYHHWSSPDCTITSAVRGPFEYQGFGHCHYLGSLQLTMMLYYAIVVVCFCLSQGQANQESPRIIIVGSGAAGIAAASRLLQNGFHNVTLLEAENRIGGRIYTTEFAGYLVDLGGQWVHGEEDNVAYELAWPLGLIDHSRSEYPTKFYSSSGSTILDETSNELMAFYLNLTQTEIPDKYLNESIGYYFKLKLDEFFENHSEINVQQRPALEQMFNLFQMSIEAGDSWFDVSAKGLREYTTCKGDHDMNWKDRGYSTILDILMKKLPNPSEELPVLNNTVFDSEVSQINYNSSDGSVRVVTAKGDEYFADHVIVTTSLGVLKADYKTLFQPPLSEAKINVIKGLEIGTVAKIYLAYDEPWWIDNATNSTSLLAMYWNEEDRIKIESDPEKSWMLGLFTFIAVEHKPRLLCAWLSGVHARAMEKIPEERVFELTKLMIRQFFGNSYNISEPTAMRRTQWFSNKHFRGTYSYRSLETERSGVMAHDLSEPIMENEKPVILFAGEATSPKYYSTVHGAIGTGWREADRLKNFYSNEKSNTEKSILS